MSTRERAINLRDWEVKAIQTGRLKMLVRPVKPQPYRDTEMRHTMFVGGTVWVRNGKLKADWAHAVKNPESMIQFCPYGQPGDRLRGREAAAELSRRKHAGCVAWKRVGTCVDATDLVGYYASTAVCALSKEDAAAIAESLIRREMLGDTPDANAKEVKS